MTDTPLVQSGEIPEIPLTEDTPYGGATLGGTVEERLERMELRQCIIAKHLLTLLERGVQDRKLIAESHAMAKEGYDLMQSPAVKMLRKVKASPFGGAHR